MKPPPIHPTVPPSNTPGKPRVTYESLLGKPDLQNLDGPVTITPGALTITSTGVPDLILERTETPAAVLDFIQFIRHASTKGYIGLDASDRVAILHSDGTTVLFYVTLPGVVHAKAGFSSDGKLELTNAGTPKGYVALDGSDHVAILHSDGSTVLAYVTLAGLFNALAGFSVAGTKVVSTQQSAIPDGTATTGSPGGSGSTGGAPTDPAFLGDVQGSYDETNALTAVVGNAAGTAATALSKVNAILAALRAHGLIAT